MAKSITSAPFKTPIGVAAWTHNLFKPRAAEEGGTLKYGCTAIFKASDDRSPFDAAVKEVILGRWHQNGLVRAKQGLIHLPFLDGNGPSAKSKQTGEFWPGFGPGTWFIRPTSGSDRPPILRYRDPNIQATEEEIYPGCRGFWVLHAYTWEHPKSGDGVSFSLTMFQKKGDGPRLDSATRIDPETWYEPIDDADDDEPPFDTDKPRRRAGGGGLFD